MRHFLTLALVTTALAGTAGADELRDQALGIFKPLPSTISCVERQCRHPRKDRPWQSPVLRSAAVGLGVFLVLFLPQPDQGDDDNMRRSVGHGWQKGPPPRAIAPTVLERGA